MPVLPSWLENLRRAEVLDRVDDDPRSGSGRFLGMDQETVVNDVCGMGQAEFDEPYVDLSPDDRVLLYAYFFQRGHLLELLTAFRELFAEPPSDVPVVVDLGCGPFTGGLALTAALGAGCRFDYVGVDRSAAMRRLGERLAEAVGRFRPDAKVTHRWAADAGSVAWARAPAWPPVLVIASYLLASPTLDVDDLVAGLERLLGQTGRGAATILYTNSAKPGPNRAYPTFRDALVERGFTVRAEGSASLPASRDSGATYARHVRYALLHRPARKVLALG